MIVGTLTKLDMEPMISLLRSVIRQIKESRKLVLNEETIATNIVNAIASYCAERKCKFSKLLTVLMTFHFLLSNNNPSTYFKNLVIIGHSKPKGLRDLVSDIYNEYFYKVVPEVIKTQDLREREELIKSFKIIILNSMLNFAVEHQYISNTKTSKSDYIRNNYPNERYLQENNYELSSLMAIANQKASDIFISANRDMFRNICANSDEITGDVIFYYVDEGTNDIKCAGWEQVHKILDTPDAPSMFGLNPSAMKQVRDIFSFGTDDLSANLTEMLIAVESFLPSLSGELMEEIIQIYDILQLFSIQNAIFGDLPIIDEILRQTRVPSNMRNYVIEHIYNYVKDVYWMKVMQVLNEYLATEEGKVMMDNFTAESTRRAKHYGSIVGKRSDVSEVFGEEEKQVEITKDAALQRSRQDRDDRYTLLPDDLLMKIQEATGLDTTYFVDNIVDFITLKTGVDDLIMEEEKKICEYCHKNPAVHTTIVPTVLHAAALGSAPPVVFNTVHSCNDERCIKRWKDRFDRVELRMDEVRWAEIMNNIEHLTAPYLSQTELYDMVQKVNASMLEQATRVSIEEMDLSLLKRLSSDVFTDEIIAARADHINNLHNIYVMERFTDEEERKLQSTLPPRQKLDTLFSLPEFQRDYLTYITFTEKRVADTEKNEVSTLILQLFSPFVLEQDVPLLDSLKGKISDALLSMFKDTNVSPSQIIHSLVVSGFNKWDDLYMILPARVIEERKDIIARLWFLIVVQYQKSAAKYNTAMEEKNPVVQFKGLLKMNAFNAQMLKILGASDLRRQMAIQTAEANVPEKLESVEMMPGCTDVSKNSAYIWILRALDKLRMDNMVAYIKKLRLTKEADIIALVKQAAVLTDYDMIRKLARRGAASISDSDLNINVKEKVMYVLGELVNPTLEQRYQGYIKKRETMRAHLEEERKQEAIEEKSVERKDAIERLERQIEEIDGRIEEMKDSLEERDLKLSQGDLEKVRKAVSYMQSNDFLDGFDFGRHIIKSFTQSHPGCITPDARNEEVDRAFSLTNGFLRALGVMIMGEWLPSMTRPERDAISMRNSVQSMLAMREQELAKSGRSMSEEEKKAFVVEEMNRLMKPAYRRRERLFDILYEREGNAENLDYALVDLIEIIEQIGGITMQELVIASPDTLSKLVDVPIWIDAYASWIEKYADEHSAAEPKAREREHRQTWLHAREFYNEVMSAIHKTKSTNDNFMFYTYTEESQMADSRDKNKAYIDSVKQMKEFEGLAWWAGKDDLMRAVIKKKDLRSPLVKEFADRFAQFKYKGSADEILERVKTHGTSENKDWQALYVQLYDKGMQENLKRFKAHRATKITYNLPYLVRTMSTSTGRKAILDQIEKIKKVIEDDKKAFRDLRLRSNEIDDEKVELAPEWEMEVIPIKKRDLVEHISQYMYEFRSLKSLYHFIHSVKDMTAYRVGMLLSGKSVPKKMMGDIVTLNNILRLSISSDKTMMYQKSFLEALLGLLAEALQMESLTFSKENVKIAGRRAELMKIAENELIKTFKISRGTEYAYVQTISYEETERKVKPGYIYDKDSGKYYSVIRVKQAECKEPNVWVKGKGCYKEVSSEDATYAVIKPVMKTQRIETKAPKYRINQPRLLEVIARGDAYKIIKPPMAPEIESKWKNVSTRIGDVISIEDLEFIQHAIRAFYRKKIQDLDDEIERTKSVSKRKQLEQTLPERKQGIESAMESAMPVVEKEVTDLQVDVLQPVQKIKRKGKKASEEKRGPVDVDSIEIDRPAGQPAFEEMEEEEEFVYERVDPDQEVPMYEDVENRVLEDESYVYNDKGEKGYVDEDGNWVPVVEQHISDVDTAPQYYDEVEEEKQPEDDEYGFLRDADEDYDAEEAEYEYDY